MARCRDCGGAGGRETRFGDPHSWRGCPTCHGTGEVDPAALLPIEERYLTSDHPAYEHARQIWTWIAERNGAETSRILAEPPDTTLEQVEREVYEVTASTINRWAREHRWAARADDEVRQAAPGIHATVTRNHLLGMLAGSRYLRRVAEGLEAPNKDRINAAIQLQFFGGRKYYTSANDDGRPATPQVDYGPSVAGRDQEALLAFVIGKDDLDDPEADHE